MADLNTNISSPWPGTLAGFAALLVGIGFGRFAYPAFIPILAERHWFTIPQADYLAATTLAGYVVGAFAAGRRSWRIGASSTIRTSMLVASASFLFCIKPLGFGWFFLWRLLAGVAGGFLMVTAVPAILARTPAKQRGRASGIIFTGIGAGIAAAGTIVPMLARRGLAQAWGGVGVACFILTILTWRYWGKFRDPGISLENPGEGRPARFGWSLGFLIAAYCACAVGFVPHSVFWVDFIARGLRQGLAAGGRYWILLGISAAAGPMIAGCAAPTA